MSRETLLDEAIAKAKEAEDWQLVEWLRMARGGESAARWYTAKLGEARLDMSKLMTENAKLREQIHWLKKGDILHVLTDQEYIDQTERERLMQVSIDALDKENAKLRELVRDMWRFTGTACKKYPRLFDPAAQGGQMVYLNMIDAFEQRMRELGVEVDG